MGFERFAGDARAIVASARRQEAETGARGVIEAEHLLLALACDPALRHLELDPDDLVAALGREEEQSLAAVGVAAADFERRPRACARAGQSWAPRRSWRSSVRRRSPCAGRSGG